MKPEFVREIRIDDGYLLVTEGVFAAVKNLRPEDQPLTMWIDQVCINQGDFDVRSQQVMLTRDIYTKSQQVYFWLGEYAELYEAAFGIMPKILDCVECTHGYLDSNLIEEITARAETRHIPEATEDVVSSLTVLYEIAGSHALGRFKRLRAPPMPRSSQDACRTPAYSFDYRVEFCLGFPWMV